MIIHHHTGRKELVTGLIKVVQTKKLSLLLCYKEPQSGARGIVEFPKEEVAALMAGLKSETLVDDGDLFRAFCGIKPT